MQVTKVESVTKTKFRVEIDEEFAFVLYKGELKRFGIAEEAEITGEVYEKIYNEVVLKRAKLRALHLLTDMARTEKELKEKLRLNQYPEDIIETAMDYVRSFGYLNDDKYAESYIESRKSSKSKKEICAALLKKGVSLEQIDLAFEVCYEKEGESEAIRRLIVKRRIDITQADEGEIYKLYGYLARKGFHYEEVRKVIEEMSG
ncbi:regulatory protein RecX [Mediterraneibacter agrestimuris]|uniref:regulatory protein RecX n=1 Tax=Mediterraneibacter agrestimuris TaxID=2941333 RepID=UPI002040C924|nr:regulatory protein RecX [Mediterraneibacter agrestimuris]